MAWLNQQQIEGLGFVRVGRNVRLSDRASYYNCAAISLGDDVRVDDFCVLSAGAGGIRIGSNVHVAVYTSLIGAAPIELGDFCNLSSRVSVYSSNDDYSGATLTNPTVPDAYRGVTNAAVRLERHVIVGSGSVVLPGVTLAEGVAIGALSLVKANCPAFTVWAGVPARQIGERKRALLSLEAKLRAGA